MTGAARPFTSALACASLGAMLAGAPAVAMAPLTDPPLHACGAEGDEAEAAALAGHLSRRFSIAAERASRIVHAAYRASHRAGLDPFLVLAMIAVESSFDPSAESRLGAKGLMQIVPKFHRKRLAAHGGEAAVLDPVKNILIGTEILQEYLRRTGSLQAALQHYNGASGDRQARYSRKVLEERRRLERALQAMDT